MRSNVAVLLVLLTARAHAAEADEMEWERARVSPAWYRVAGVEIKVAQPYAIHPHEVSVAMYGECVKAGRCGKPRIPAQQGTEAVRGVRYKDAAAYCAFIGRRLPSEAEWLRVAYPPHPLQAGTLPPYHYTTPVPPATNPPAEPPPLDPVDPDPFAGDVSKVRKGTWTVMNYTPGWVWSANDHVAVEVGTVANMHANLAEWIATSDGTATPRALVRGASFRTPGATSIHHRRYESADASPDDVGFRCVQDIVPLGQRRKPVVWQGGQALVREGGAAFAIDPDEVSVAQYQWCVSNGKCRAAAFPGKATDPVRGISYADAEAYCRALRRRLPTVTEWRRLAGSGTDVGAVRRGEGPLEHVFQVMLPKDTFLQREPNWHEGRRAAEAGLTVDIRYVDGVYIHHLHGNVSEWMSDPGLPRGRAAVGGGSFRASGRSGATQLRDEDANAPLEDVGFRCARNVR